MSIAARAGLVMVLLVPLLPAPATAAKRRCQDVVADAGLVLLGRSLQDVASCTQRIADGRRRTTTTCAPATRRLTTAVVAATIKRFCGATIPFAPAGDCEGARTPKTLAACLADTAAANALDVFRPLRVGPQLLPGRRCVAEASRTVRGFTLGRLHTLQRCKHAPPADLSPGTECASAAVVAGQLASLRAHAAARIGRCGDSTVAAMALHDACAGVKTTAGLADCLLGTAVTTSDRALRAEYPDAGFCGDAGAAVEARVDKLLAQMTVAEKLDQMHGNAFLPHSTTAANDRLGIPGFLMNDGPRGIGAAVGNATCFPVGMARGATWDEALEQRVGDVFGVEARAKGVSVVLAPTMNLLRHPRWGRAQETYGEDTTHLGHMASAFIRGVQGHAIASAKHFAGNSIEDTRFDVSVDVDERTLREVYLRHFQMAVQEAHTGSVMSAYNRVNGTYCGENPHLLHDVLKGDWGFQGFVESDWFAGTRSTVPAANAGLDIEMPTPQYFGKPLTDAVNAGQVSQATIDGAVRRILRTKLCFRLDTDPPKADPSQVQTTAHTDLTREVEQKAIVLLKNDGGLLPLRAPSLHSIAVVGELAGMANLGDHGSSNVFPSFAVTPLDGITARATGVTVTHVRTAAPMPGDPPLSAGDTSAVASADVAVVVAGLTFVDEGEKIGVFGDRKGLDLPGDQNALVAAVAAANPHTIVVLEGSGPVTMPWLADVPAVVMAWYPGQEGGNAIADVLFGDVNPSGKLPVSFPRAEADLPPFDNTSKDVAYGYLHGYRWLDANGTAPLFPFGFGLSYTTFRYANLTVVPDTISRYGRVHVTADVTNTGTVAGDEVAELYVGYEGSRVQRAIADLKAFARVHLGAGETKTVGFDVGAADVAYWDSAAGAFVAEPITYDVRVGPSSRDLPLAGRFAVRP